MIRILLVIIMIMIMIIITISSSSIIMPFLNAPIRKTVKTVNAE